MSVGNLILWVKPQTRWAVMDVLSRRHLWLCLILAFKPIQKISEGRAIATYYDKVDAPTIDACMRRGDYPMVQFYLPNGRSHWAMIVKHDARGYHMRDPLRISKKPLIFPAGIKGYRAVRCIGLAEK